MGRAAAHEAAVRAYASWLAEDEPKQKWLRMRMRARLRGKLLVCHCARHALRATRCRVTRRSSQWWPIRMWSLQSCRPGELRQGRESIKGFTISGSFLRPGSGGSQPGGGDLVATIIDP